MKQARRPSDHKVRPEDKASGSGRNPNIATVHESVPANAGLKYETLVRSFTSNHVMKYCEKLCYQAWTDAQADLERSQEVDKLSSDDRIKPIFDKRMDALKSKMRPRCEESFAAVVMADVSGYSNLSSTLAEKGAEGAEILSKTMKGYLDKVKKSLS